MTKREAEMVDEMKRAFGNVQDKIERKMTSEDKKVPTEAEKIVQLKKHKSNVKKEERKLTENEKIYLDKRNKFINEWCNDWSPVRQAIAYFDLSQAVANLIARSDPKAGEALKKATKESLIVKP